MINIKQNGFLSLKGGHHPHLPTTLCLILPWNNMQDACYQYHHSETICLLWKTNAWIIFHLHQFDHLNGIQIIPDPLLEAAVTSTNTRYFIRLWALCQATV